jgi:hypothetical protein
MGMEGIHEWYLNLCTERHVDPKSIVIRPHLNSKSNMTNNQVWERYIRQVKDNKGKDWAKILVEANCTNNSLDQLANRKDWEKKNQNQKQKKKKPEG